MKNTGSTTISGKRISGFYYIVIRRWKCLFYLIPK